MGSVGTGFVRKVDELGRIVIPSQVRKSLGIETKDNLELIVDEDKIIMQKIETGDIFTGSKEDLVEYKGKLVSKSSIKELAEQIGLI